MKSDASKVSPLGAGVNPSLDDAVFWVEKKGEGGSINPTTARLIGTAIGKLRNVLQEDEPQTARHFFDNLQDIGDRWARLNPENKPETARTYKARAERGLKWFLDFHADPGNFRFDVRPVTRVAGAGDDGERRTKKPPTATTALPVMRSVPLGDGRVFDFRVDDRWSIRDAKKVAWHLLTLAADFDPDVHTWRNGGEGGSSLSQT